MGDGYYYTLSAIAQSFAAIIALHAIFSIYKLQILTNYRNELLKKLREVKLREMIKINKWGRNIAIDEVEEMSEDYLLAWSEDGSGNVGIVRKKTEIHREIDKNERSSKEITDWLKRTLPLNGVTILLSLTLLPWKNLLPNDLQYLFLIITLLFALFTLLVTIRATFITIAG